MRRIATILLFLLIGIPVFAGTSAVTATITDSDSQTWNNGTFVATFVGQPGVPLSSYNVNGSPFTQSVSGSMSGAGIITVTLTDLSTIAPSGGQWKFQLCPNATATCAFVITNAVVGATPNLSSALSTGLAGPRFGPGPTAYGYLDVEVGIPAAPLFPGARYFNVTSSAERIWNGSAWSNSGVSTFTGISGKPFVNSQDYGVVGEGHFSFNATISSGSAIVTCTDCHFLTNATIGQIVYGSNLTTSGFSFTTVIELSQTTILSIDSDTQIHANTTASGNGGFLVWGTDESTQLTTAWNAAFAACSMLVLPGVNPEGTGPAVILVQSAQFAGNGSSCLGTGGARKGVGVMGMGIGSSFIMITPNVATPSGSALFFNSVTDGLDIHDFTIHGGGNSAPGSGFNGKTGLLVSALNNAKVRDIALLFFGGNQFTTTTSTTGFVGLQVNGGAISLDNVDVDGFGAIGCEFTSNSNIGPVTLRYQVCFDNAFLNVFANDGGTTPTNPVMSYGGYYGNVSVANGFTANLDVAGGSQYYGVSDYWGCGGSNAGGQAPQLCGGASNLVVGYNLVSETAGQGGALSLDASVVDFKTAAGSGSFLSNDNSANTITLSGSIIKCETSTGGSTFIKNAGVVQDLGGNALTPTGCTTAYSGAGRITSQPSLANATTITAGKAVLSAGWGTTATWSALAGGNNYTGTITASGTGQGANPTITYTFPTPYFTAPFYCQAIQVGGTQASGTFTASSVSATGATFTYSGTPGVGNTVFVQVNCQ